ncbi:MAG TPA: type II toxin-antitoxin system RelE/ParE family toxin, partial [Bacteroidia bacterium]|nr:type II toxin-antitoxin system RelE/ParE family toxin [Bacteroidia bacterium]
MAKRGISWDKKAWQDFINILEYIREDSPENAIRVGVRVATVIELITEHPKMFKQDAMKMRNDGSFRVFVQDSIRITYRIKPKEIRIERIRHTS